MCSDTNQVCYRTTIQQLDRPPLRFGQVNIKINEAKNIARHSRSTRMLTTHSRHIRPASTRREVRHEIRNDKPKGSNDVSFRSPISVCDTRFTTSVCEGTRISRFVECDHWVVFSRDSRKQSQNAPAGQWTMQYILLLT